MRLFPSFSSRNLAVAALVVSASVGCKKSGKDRVVAKVGGSEITVADFEKRLAETSPLLRSRYNTVERKREFLENMIRNELLAQEAEHRGLEKSPAVREAMKRAMVQELLRSEFEAGASAQVSDADLKRYYDDHKAEFVRPQMAQGSHILLVADAKSKGRVKVEAEKLLADIRAREKKGEATAFAQAAQKLSGDPATRSLGGQLRFMTQDEMSNELGAEAAKALFSLQAPGDEAGPVETAKGFEILRLQTKTVPMDRKFEESKESIRSLIGRDSRSKNYEQFIKDLRGKSKVSVDDAALAAAGIASTESGPNPMKSAQAASR